MNDEVLTLWSRTSPVLYRHVDNIAADFLTKGSIRLRRLSSYRKMENEEEGIQDPMEGSAEIQAKTININNDTDPKVREQLQHFGINFGENGTGTVRGTFMRQSVSDCWVLCLTEEPVSQWKNRPHTWEVNDHAGLMSAIMKAGIKDIKQASLGPVDYKPRTGIAGIDIEIFASALTKSPEFSHQREHRLVCEFGRPSTFEYIDVQVPEILKYSKIYRKKTDT